ncbi:MAG: hypothetical protein H7Z43_07260 [Clostridia bacterium]|nr:hypothetical protein [Deltaproteobacteria bacterium]
MEMQAYNGEKTLVSQASARKATTPTEAPDYNLGWIVATSPWTEGPFLTHDGSNTLFYATASVAPERQLAFFAATNTGEGIEADHQAVEAAVKSVLGDGP